MKKLQQKEKILNNTFVAFKTQNGTSQMFANYMSSTSNVLYINQNFYSTTEANYISTKTTL